MTEECRDESCAIVKLTCTKCDKEETLRIKPDRGRRWLECFIAMQTGRAFNLPDDTPLGKSLCCRAWLYGEIIKTALDNGGKE